MLTMHDLDPLLIHRGAVFTDRGEKVGSVGEVYLDDSTGEPAWVTVHTGLFGSRESLVPLRGATVEDDRLVVAVPKDLIRHAPSVERDGHLSPEDEAALYRHYDLQPQASLATDASDDSTTVTEARAKGHDSGEPWMIRSEERLRIGTEQHETARVRLRKYVVAEEAAVTVPLRREEVRVDIEPVTATTGGGSAEGALFQEESVEIVLREERPVVSKETVVAERVTMRKVAVARRATVREEVRKERIVSSIDGAVTGGTGTPGSTRGRGTSSAAGTEPGQSGLVTRSPNALLKGKNKRR
jgi:uncharacterized protein (TIGR02271 family)